MPVLERAKGRERTPAPRVALHRFVAAPTPDPGAGRSRSRRAGRVPGGAVRGGRPVPESKSEEGGEEEEEVEVEPSPGLPTISTALPPSPSPSPSSLLPPP
jgi:hypothetical protein